MKVFCGVYNVLAVFFQIFIRTFAAALVLLPLLAGCLPTLSNPNPPLFMRLFIHHSSTALHRSTLFLCLVGSLFALPYGTLCAQPRPSTGRATTPDETWYRMGFEFYNKALYSEAEQAFSEAIRLQPRYSEYYNQRANTRNLMQKYTEAMNDYNRAIDLNPRSSQALFNRGSLFNDLEQYQKAEADLSASLRIDSLNAVAYTNRGYARTLMQRYDDAIKDCTRAIRIDPRCAHAYNNRGIVYLWQGKYKEALDDFTHSIEFGHPNTYIPYNNKGDVLGKLGRCSEAIECYQKALSLYPDYKPAQQNLAAAIKLCKV